MPQVVETSLVGAGRTDLCASVVAPYPYLCELNLKLSWIVIHRRCEVDICFMTNLSKPVSG